MGRSGLDSNVAVSPPQILASKLSRLASVVGIIQQEEAISHHHGYRTERNGLGAGGSGSTWLEFRVDRGGGGGDRGGRRVPKHYYLHLNGTQRNGEKKQVEKGVDFSVLSRLRNPIVALNLNRVATRTDDVHRSLVIACRRLVLLDASRYFFCATRRCGAHGTKANFLWWFVFHRPPGLVVHSFA